MRKLLLSVILITVFSFSNAKSISSQEAFALANSFLKRSVVLAEKSDESISSKKKENKFSVTEKPFYIFNAANGKGFVIIAADDRAKKILGYSENGHISIDNLPPQLQSLLELYSSQINDAIGTTQSSTDITQEEQTISDSRSIMLNTANWGQGNPYNNLCPTTPDNNISPTGCVATAMAIIMKYHNWPNNGEGECSYTNPDQHIQEKLSFNFSECNFEWDKMPNTLSETTTDEEKNAIAKLMRATGISIHTVYNPSQSGAYIEDVVFALREYFKYDKSCQCIARYNFSTDDYLKIIKNEIDNQRPVLMGGQRNTVGHAWVVDGYDTQTEYLHFNWGWEGESNGFFSLDATSDSDPFSDNRHILINITPQQSNEAVAIPYLEYPTMLALQSANKDNTQGGLSLNKNNLSINEKFDAYANLIVLPPNSTYDFCLALTDDTGAVKAITNSNSIHNSFESNSRSTLLFKDLFFDNIESIDPEWNIQLMARNVSEGDYTHPFLPMTGTLDAPSRIKIKDMSFKISTIEIKTDEYARIQLNSNFDPSEAAYYSDGEEFNVIPGTHVNFIASVSEILDDHSITVLLNGEYQVNINATPMTITDSNHHYIRGEFIAKAGISTVEIQYEQMSSSSNLIIETAGTLEETISPKDARKIKEITISGEMNARDFWYITKEFQSLSKIDLSQVTIKDSFNDVVPNYDNIIPTQNQPADYLPDQSFWGMKRLHEIVLPESISGIGDRVAHNCNIKALRIPQNVTFLYGEIAKENPGISIYCENPTPPDHHWVSYDIHNEGTLYVPVGSLNAYREAAVWKNFINIREMEVLPSSIKILSDDSTIDIGSSISLKAEVYPVNSTDKCIFWTSEKESIAIIDSHGNVKAVSPGTTIISARPEFGKGFDSIKITVNNPVKIERIELSNEKLSIVDGSTKQLTVSVFPQNATTKTITWNSSNEGVASVDENGLVRGIQPGECEIYATTNDGTNLTAKCSINVIPYTSSLNEIINNSEHFDIYTLNGMLIKSNANKDSLEELIPAIYLLKLNNNVIKFIRK